MIHAIPLVICVVGCLVRQEIAASDNKLDWWKYTNIYQIYLQSYKDSNADGMGDLKGLKNKLKYLAELGVETIYLNPYFASPDPQRTYEISNYTDINTAFGTLADFEELTSEMKKLGLKLMIDLVLNHCGRSHEWFVKSVEKMEPYVDYFIWKDPKKYEWGRPSAPNNWLSVSKDGSAWTWNQRRNQFYYHQISENQPDLDLRNPNVIREIKDIIRFWFLKGVDALRIESVSHLVEDKDFTDEPWKSGYFGSDKYWSMDHIYTIDQPENYDVVHDIRRFIDEKFTNEDGYTRLLCTVQTWTMNATVAYYGSTEREMAHFPFNDILLNVVDHPNAPFYNGLIRNWLANISIGSVPNWMSGNHDSPRTTDKQGTEFTDIYNIMVTMLPGVSIMYYGQEIGMEDAFIRTQSGQQTNRSPMQWDNTINAGFTTNPKPWMPINPNYWRVNVEAAKKDLNSPYYVVKKLLEIRKTATAKFGDLKTYDMGSWTYAFTRTYVGHQTYVVVFNFGSETELINLRRYEKKLNNKLRILTSSTNSGYKPGDIVPTTADSQNPHERFTMRPKTAIVLTTELTKPVTTTQVFSESSPSTPVTTEQAQVTTKSNNDINNNNAVTLTNISLVILLLSRIIDLILV